MEYNYDYYVTQYSNSFIGVRIPMEKVQKIATFVQQLVAKKLEESQHQLDGNKEITRFTTGLMGEAAVEQLLGIDIIDWTIGDSKQYNHPDIPGYNVGIKTVERGKFPVIYKNNSYPQIMCIKSDKFFNGVFVCGLATSDVLNTFQDTSLLLDPALRAKGFKTGFYGFKQLKPINSLDDILIYKKIS